MCNPQLQARACIHLFSSKACCLYFSSWAALQMTARTAPHNVPSALPRAALPSRAAHSTALTLRWLSALSVPTTTSRLPTPRFTRYSLPITSIYTAAALCPRQEADGTRFFRPAPSPIQRPLQSHGRAEHAAQGRRTPHSAGSPGRPAALLLPPRRGPALTQAHEEHGLHFPRRHLRSGKTARRGPGAQPRRLALRL